MIGTSWFRPLLCVCLGLWCAGAVLSATSRSIYAPAAAGAGAEIVVYEPGSLREMLRPTSSVDYLGQMMMVTGAFPGVLACYTLPARLWTDVLVPTTRWLCEQWRAFERFVRAWLTELLDCALAVLRATAIWAAWFADTFLAPTARIIWAAILWLGRTAATIVCLSLRAAAAVLTFCLVDPLLWTGGLGWAAVCAANDLFSLVLSAIFALV